MRAQKILTLCAAPLLAVTVAAPLVLAGTPAGAQTAPPTPASTADGYGLYVGAALLAGNVPVNVPAVSRATQSCPPQGPAQNANVVQAGPIPADGSLVQNASAVSGTATADCSPMATATGSASNVQLLATANVKPQITADVLKGESTTSCSAAPSAAGSAFVNLSVGGQPIPATPPPNTTINLGAVTVIVNEQHPAADGRGLVVNALHVFGNNAAAGLFIGDIIVGHAYSAVTCSDATLNNPTAIGTGTGQSPIQLSKVASSPTVAPGGQETYTVTINNASTTACLVNAFIEHLAPVFTYNSTSGALGTTATTANRPGGGQDVTISTPMTPVTIAAHSSATQTFVVTANSNAAPGVYANDIELLCSDLGDFVGHGAPVTVTGAAAATGNTGAPATGNTSAPAAPTLPRTGAPSPLVPIGGAVILAGAVATGAVRRRRALR